ncbi:hypothetical protein L1987_26717 [Smallanthus sonchifolius]|uniref:Uncharacterized protein n=1 Tax=Smallanthus sonchifolius TaxID=185202 RepID=A0ACB9I9F6_9ASTR|nr:hypothetical protein L1987_26717 [Smallanthus sonchifolius]
MHILDGAGSCWVGLGDPFSIWTTYLKEVVSAWTKVVGYGFGFGLGVISGVRVAPPAAVLLPWLDEELAGDGISLPCFFEMVSIERVLHYLENRHRVHKDVIEFCKSILQRKSIDWDATFHNDLSRPIQNVDLVVTVGDDGTLLKASHLLNDSIPLLGVNSDPTQPQEVKELSNEFDATRSTGYLCAATAKNFEHVR